MKIFSFLQSGKRTPAWVYPAKGQIWRIMFSETGRIVGECRQHEEKSSSFFCLAEGSGARVWEGVRLAEPWWVGIEAIHKHMLFLHEYRKPDLPEHQRIRAIEIETGDLKWKNDDLTFLFAYGDRVYGYRDLFEKRVAYAMDAETGEVVEAYENGLEELQSLRNLASAEQREEEYLFPQVFSERMSEPEVKRLVMKETKKNPVQGNIEIIRERALLLMNFYVPSRDSMPNAQLLENHFAVYDVQNENKVFSEVLTRDARMPTPDSFFVKSHSAYFIKDQHILTALRLWKS